MPRTHPKVSYLLEAQCLTPDGAAALVENAFRVLEGRWKLAIVFRLFAFDSLRYSELERSLPGVSQKVLAQRLRELERDGIVGRTVHPEVPPRVEYCLTERGRALRPVLGSLREWSVSGKVTEGAFDRTVSGDE